MDALFNMASLYGPTEAYSATSAFCPKITFTKKLRAY